MDAADKSQATAMTGRAGEANLQVLAAIDSPHEALISESLDGVITAWNRGAERIFGYTADEAVGRHISLILPDDRKAEADDVRARLQRGDAVVRSESVRLARDRRLVPISIIISPVTDADGAVVGAASVARDLTERQNSEELRAWLAAIVDCSDDAIVSKTLDGVITSWNRGAERIFGYTAAEAVGRHITLIIPDDRRAEEDDVLARLRRGERVDHFETIRRTKDGRLISISLTVSPVRDSRGAMIGASKVARDISERKLAEAALRQVRDELEERVRERTASLSSANEALRLEIAERHRVERERLQLLRRLVLAQEDERRRIARELHDQLGQQLTALRLTLETLKAQSTGRTDLRTQLETLEELARQLDRDVAFRVWELRPNAAEGVGLPAALTTYVGNWSKRFGVRARLHTSPMTDERLPVEVETTMYRLAQEALNNVAKHARADSVDVVLERSAEYVSLIVEDNGVGFDPAKAAKDGRLGLIGMRERASLVGADLLIESAPGRGTTVIVRTPAAVRSIEHA